MKTKNIFLNTLVVIIFLNTNYLIAQTNTSPTQTVCAGSIAEPYLINPASPGSIYYWSISGGGVIASGQGTNQIFVDWSTTPGGPYTIAVVEEDVNGCFGDSIKVEVTIADAAIASTINTDNICEGSAYTVSGATASNYSSLSWSSSGTGTFILGSTLTPVYTPSASDISNGNVTLTLTAHGNAPCIDATSNILLSIIPLPSVDAGSDDNICEGSTFTPNTTLASNYSSISWSTSGTGTFTLGNTLNPIYTPSSADILSGTVTLTLAASGNSPCSNVTDDMLLTIVPISVVDAGITTDICEGSTYTVSGATASNYSSISWSTSGTGTFTLGNTLTPIYTPSSADITNGSVVLTISVLGSAPCNITPIISSMILNIIPAPISDAGSDDYICQGVDYTFITGYASTLHSASVSWVTSGDGTFTNVSTLTPTYSPGPNDIINGTVDLSLISTGNNPCATDVDDMTLIINQAPSTGPINHW
tara:strand:+ start:3095 stop:4525 length:1431 start_codon:yes stop_codon:yes gene_type:complete